MHVKLSNGQSAELVDIDAVTSRQRKRLFRDLGFDQGSTPATPLQVPDITLAHVLLSWTLDAKLPTPEDFAIDRNAETSLDDLTTADYDALAVQATVIIGAITPDFEPSPDPKSPTEPSGDSEKS